MKKKGAPKPTKLKRYTPRPMAGQRSGHFDHDVLDSEVLLRVGAITTRWAHLEEHLACLLSMLAEIPNDHTGTFIFRAIISQQVRLKVLTNLLQKHYINREQGSFFDDVLNEFWELNRLRNSYSHSVWYTDMQTNETLLVDSDGPAYMEIGDAPVITVPQLDEVLRRMDFLGRKITDYRLARAKMREMPESSPNKPPPPLPEAS